MQLNQILVKFFFPQKIIIANFKMSFTIIIIGETLSSVLHYIAASWDCSVAEIAISHGCDSNHVDFQGRAPLHIAAYFNHCNMIDYLLENGGKNLLA